ATATSLSTARNVPGGWTYRHVAPLRSQARGCRSPEWPTATTSPEGRTEAARMTSGPCGSGTRAPVACATGSVGATLTIAVGAVSPVRARFTGCTTVGASTASGAAGTGRSSMVWVVSYDGSGAVGAFQSGTGGRAAGATCGAAVMAAPRLTAYFGCASTAIRA